MTQGLRALQPHDLAAELEKTLLPFLAETLKARKDGHCMRVSDLDDALMIRVASRLQAEVPHAQVVLLMEQPSSAVPTGLGISSTKLVELRNELPDGSKRPPLMAFVPNEFRAAAEDSFGIATFEEVAVGEIYNSLKDRLLNEIPSDFKGPLLELLRRLTEGDSPWPFASDVAVVRFLLTARLNGFDGEAFGAALYELGLVPDFQLFDEPEKAPNRANLNRSCVERITWSELSERGRVLALGLSDKAFRAQLAEFLVQSGVEEPCHWTHRIILDRSYWKLAFNHWEFEDSEDLDSAYIFDVSTNLPTVADDEEHATLKQLVGQQFLPLGKDGLKKFNVTFSVDPHPERIEGLSKFVLQVISKDHGPVGLVRSKGIWKAKKTEANVPFTKLTKVDWEEGWYFVRVLAKTEDDDLIPLVDEYGKPLPWAADDDAPVTRVNESDLFYVLPDAEVEVEPEQRAVQKEDSLMHAWFRLQFSALLDGRDYRAVQPQSVNWQQSAGASRAAGTENLELKFGREGTLSVPVSKTLKQLEQRILAAPEGPLSWHIPIVNGSSGECTGTSAQWPANEMADEFLQARARYFEALRCEPKELITQAADLVSLRPLIVEYADTYGQLIQKCLRLAESREQSIAQKALLDLRHLSALDSVQIIIKDHRGRRRESVLVAPTHPVRALWLSGWSEMGKSWLEKAAQVNQHVVATRDALLRNLAPIGFPSVLPTNDGSLLTAVDNLTPFWTLYAAADEADPRSLVGHVCDVLSLPEPDIGGVGINGGYLATRVQRYLIQHPYVQTLVINAFNTGRSVALASMLLKLQKQKAFSHIRYDIRLFVQDANAPGVGENLVELLSPIANAQVGEADAFSTISGNHLNPKLGLAIKPIAEFRKNPERYGAHLSMLFDVFPAQEVGAVVAPKQEGNAPVHGLIQDFQVSYAEDNDVIAWSRYPKHGQALELKGTEELTDLLSSLPGLMSTSIAVSATGKTGVRLRPEITMALGMEHRSLLHQVHESSDWVMTVDRNLGIEFFDHGRLASRPDYLIDHSPEATIGLGHKLFITSRSITELEALLKPVLEQYNLKSSSSHVVSVLDQLRSLSGRLALKLISSPTQRAEAMGLALSRMYLEHQGVFENQILVPLDAHLELYQALKKQADELGDEISFKRTDMALFDLDVAARKITCRLVEVKCYSDVGDLASYELLKDHITSQISESESVLAQHFDPMHANEDRPDRLIKNRELVNLLGFYLERTQRYGSICDDAAQEARFFLDTIEDGYQMGFTRSALIFDFAKPGTEPAELDCGIEFHRIGYDLIQEMVDAAAIALGEVSASEAELVTTPTAQKTQELALKRTNAPSLPTLDEAAFLAIKRDRTVTWDVYHEPECSDNEQAGAEFTGQQSEGLGHSHDENPGHSSVESLESIEETKPEEQNSEEQFEPEGRVSEPQDEAMTTSNIIKETTTYNAEANAADRGQASFTEASSKSETLSYDIMLGVNGNSEQYGLLGEVAGRKVALDLNHTHTISLFGVQGGGKSYTLGTVVEMATTKIPAINQIKKPLSTVIFHYSPTQDYKPEFTSMISANDDQKQLQALKERYGAEPTCLKDVVLLTPEEKLDQRRSEYPGIEVHSLKFASSELQAGHWKFLMGAVGNQAAYIRQMTNIMRQNRRSLTLDVLRQGVENSRMSDSMKDLATMRLDFAGQYIDDQLGVSGLIRPGRMIIVDLRDEFIEKDEALGLFVVLLQIFSEAKYQGEAFNKLIVFDECHKYIDSPDLVKGLIEVVREMRHKGTSVMVASQDPPSVPVELIELSSQVILHKFNSPAWLKHIQKANSALNQLTPQKLASLQPGEAFVWSSKASDLEFTKQALKVRCRPRVTKHGGDTVTAV